MGTHTHAASRSSDIASALFTKVQQRVLALLFGQPDRRFQSSELIRLAGSGTGAAHRYVALLVGSGLVTATPIGNQRHYQANKSSPVFEELRALVEKTVGLAEPLRESLRTLRSRIAAAFVYGSIAKRTDTAASDVDLLVISDDLEYAELYAAIATAERRLARRINPTIMSPGDWSRKSSIRDSFASRVRTSRRIVIFEATDG